MLGKRLRESFDKTPQYMPHDTEISDPETYSRRIVHILQNEINTFSVDNDNSPYVNFLRELLMGLHIQRTLLFQSSYAFSPTRKLENIISNALETVPPGKPRIRKYCMEFIILHRYSMEEYLTKPGSTCVTAASMVFAENFLNSLVAEVLTTEGTRT